MIAVKGCKCTNSKTAAGLHKAWSWNRRHGVKLPCRVTVVEVIRITGPETPRQQTISGHIFYGQAKDLLANTGFGGRSPEYEGR